MRLSRLFHKLLIIFTKNVNFTFFGMEFYNFSKNMQDPVEDVDDE